MHVERDQARTLLATGVLAAAFVAAMWLPHAMKERNLRQRIEKAQASINQDRAKVEGLAELSSQVVSLRNEVESSHRYVASEEEIPAMLRELSRELEARRVTDQEIQTQAVIEASNYRILPVTLKFKGSIESVMGFLSRLETMRQVIRVNRFELTRNQDPSVTVLAARIELSVFHAQSEAQGK